MSRAEKRKYHYIYKTTCSITDKFYIGMHSTDDLEDGYVGSGTYLWRSIDKHGKENHATEILEFISSREDLKLREAFIVNEELLGDKQCMNLCLGGGDGWEYVHRTGAHKKGAHEASKVLKARLGNDPEFRKSFCDTISKRSKANWAAGVFDHIDPRTFTGRTHTDESKAKMREAILGKQEGEKNTQFGTRWAWINKDGVAKRVPLLELENYLADSWIKGQKPKVARIKKVRVKKAWPTMNCHLCEAEFEVHPREITRGRKYCSISCSAKVQFSDRNK